LVHAGTRARRSLETVAVAPPRALGVIVGGGFTVWAAALAGLAAKVAADGSPEFKTFLASVVAAVLAVVALAFANWTYSLWTLTYTVDRDTLTIRWGMREVVIPIDTIQRMVPGRTLDEARVRGVNWWGCHVGVAEVKRIGYTLFYSTHSSPDELLFVVTNEESYALTVLDQAAFAEEVQARAALGPVEEHVQRSTAFGLAALPFWRDRVALAAAASSVALCALLCGYVFASYPGLPGVVQLSFPALGGVVRVGDKSELLRLAYLGVGVLAVNASLGIVVHTRERAAGLWLLASSGMLQLVLLGAAILAFQKA
jgi:Bacterial PH domain